MSFKISDALLEAIEIEKILERANNWGLRWEVETFAEKDIKDNPSMNRLDAYIYAYNDWIK